MGYHMDPSVNLESSKVLVILNEKEISSACHLKENCNSKTSSFHLKGRPKSCKMRPKSLKSAKPFSRYSTLKTEILTILQEKTTEKRKILFV